MSEPIFISYGRIPGDSLQGLLEDFATRAGTDYGELELTLNARVEMIRGQLESGTAVLAYLPLDDSVQIVSFAEAKKMGFVPDRQE